MRRSFLISLLIAAFLLVACVPPAPAAVTPEPPGETALETQPETPSEATAEPTSQPAAEAPAGEQAGEAAPSGIDEAALDDLLNLWIGSGNPLCDAPGGVLLVDSPSGRYLKAGGVASTEDGRPLKVDDRLQIGSNTKAFTVILALQLQEAGVLSMDDPLSKWLPELAARIPNGDRITLRQMAGNTSGIWDYADPLMQPLVDNNDQEGLAKAYTPQELIELVIADGKPTFAPGEGWHYSSTNFILLGMVVEAATGQVAGRALPGAHLRPAGDDEHQLPGGIA